MVSSPESHYNAKEYFFYSLLQIKSLMPQHSDIYHACSPLEAIYTPPEKTVVSFHDLVYITDPRLGSAAMNTWYRRLVSEQVFKYACRKAIQSRFIVASNEHNKKELMDYLRVPEEKIRIIRYGVRDDLDPQPKSDKVRRIGYLSYLYSRKRIDLLIEAFKNSRIEAELVIGGEGDEKAHLQELASGDKRIKFLGFIPDDKLSEFYNSLDMFIFPTNFEGYGLPMIEAMACKKPVVVLQDAIMPEEIKRRCFVFRDLTDLDRIWEQVNCSKMIQVEDNYLFAKKHSWTSTVSEYEKLYREVAHG